MTGRTYLRMTIASVTETEENLRVTGIEERFSAWICSGIDGLYSLTNKEKEQNRNNMKPRELVGIMR